NLQYYNLDPAQMEKIYEEVIARLSQMQSDALIEKTDSISKTDSINKAVTISKTDSISKMDTISD
ncbi:MAG: hypothetical protein Q8T08_15840, partial [Ignavibacteria bacterium]|nr:hypothetical protein [Ignavibacteria bacterium]